MKKNVLFLLSLCVVLLALAACPRRQDAPKSGTVTQTIAPAAAKPDTTGTDALTQTVDIEDGRSEEDGGVITTPQSTAKTGTTATTSTHSTKSSGKAGAKKH